MYNLMDQKCFVIFVYRKVIEFLLISFPFTTQLRRFKANESNFVSPYKHWCDSKVTGLTNTARDQMDYYIWIYSKIVFNFISIIKL